MRTFLVTALVVTAVAFLVFAWSAPRLWAEEWMLMGREGGCVTLAQAAERRPLFDGVTTPDELVDRLRQQGEEVPRQDITQGGVTAVQVTRQGSGSVSFSCRARSAGDRRGGEVSYEDVYGG